MNVAIFIATILEYVSFFYVIFRKKFRVYSWKKIACVGAILLIFICGSFGKWRIELLLLLGLLTSAAIVYLLFEISMAEIIKMYLVAFPALSMLETIVEYVLAVVLTIGEAERTIIYIVCIIIGLWLYYVILGKTLDEDAFDMPGHIWIAISGVLFLLVGMISYFTYVLTTIRYSNAGEIGLALVTVGGFVIFVLIYIMLYHFNINQKYRLQTELLIHYNEQQREYFEQLLEKEQSTRQFRHDMISDLLQMQNFCKKNEYDGLEKYLSEMLKDISVISKDNYDVGNEIINTVINSYFHPIRKFCEIKVRGFVNDELNISQRDLCVVVSNLVKNAVEALENSQSDSKTIVFEVKQGKQFLNIMVKNTVDYEKISVKNNLPITTKKDKKMHGLGLENVVKVAEKYNGKYEYTIEKGYYIAEIYMQI